MLSFHPLSGFSSYLCTTKTLKTVFEGKFSSPVGVFFLFIVPLAALDMLNAEFSSPVGVFFLFIYPKINKTLTFIMFSSPVGVFFLSIERLMVL